ncbi:hypothetical protein Kpho02_37000 [Kitasatospora phosalacinea]|uniref:DUF4333 domain-containing protein n=1 Tax=Kitasatospora phosalacinea TaxID=2065 RepID=A0A9W6V178_9ACTN|nr:DUF4333 domain-containing protein [Kitasatospora phosalacinea]GLW71401.1 hypothetical protein Kpho02_37000 [Kitasatospora phosalacinea]
MRIPTPLLAGALAALLLTSACSSAAGPAPDTAAGKASGSASETAGGAALPVAVNGPVEGVYLIPSRAGDALSVERPAKDAPLEEQIGAKLREDLLQRALVPGRTSVSCPDGIKVEAGVTSRCTVAYEGVEVPYAVQISSSYDPKQGLVSYTMSPMKVLVVAKTVQAKLYDNYGPGSGLADTSKLACQEMPAVAAYDSGVDTGFTCQYWSPHAPNGKPGYTTLQVVIRGSGFQFKPTG